jgi:hypothetical protein
MSQQAQLSTIQAAIKHEKEKLLKARSTENYPADEVRADCTSALNRLLALRDQLTKPRVDPTGVSLKNAFSKSKKVVHDYAA